MPPLFFFFNSGNHSCSSTFSKTPFKIKFRRTGLELTILANRLGLPRKMWSTGNHFTDSIERAADARREHTASPGEHRRPPPAAALRGCRTAIPDPRGEPGRAGLSLPAERRAVPCPGSRARSPGCRAAEPPWPRSRRCRRAEGRGGRGRAGPCGAGGGAGAVRSQARGAPLAAAGRNWRALRRPWGERPCSKTPSCAKPADRRSQRPDRDTQLRPTADSYSQTMLALSPNAPPLLPPCVRLRPVFTKSRKKQMLFSAMK